MIGAVCAYSSAWKENGRKAAKKRGVYKYTKLKAKSLQYVDVTGNQNPADVILIFLNRKYASSQASHKKQPGLFATKTMNIQQLKENCQRLLVEIEELKEQSQILANELQEFIKKMKNEQK